LVKKTNQKDLIKIIVSKSTYPKWHFGQVRHGGKKTIISYSERFHLGWGIPTITLHKQVANDDPNYFASHGLKKIKKRHKILLKICQC